MIERIKSVIRDHYGGEQEWFLRVLKYGNWQYFDQQEFRYREEYHITIDKIQIVVSDLQAGRYRVAVGVPGNYPFARKWYDVEFAATGTEDTAWEYGVRLLLADAQSHPNVVCERPVI